MGYVIMFTMKLAAGLIVTTLVLLATLPVQAGGLRVPENLRVESLECGEAPKYYVNLAWDEVEFATSYRFYSRVKDDQYSSYDEVVESKYRLTFNPEFDFYIAVSAVNNEESDLSAEYLVAIPKSLSDLCPQAVGESLSAKEALLVESSDPEATSSIKRETLIEKDQSEQLAEQILQASPQPTPTSPAKLAPTPLPIQRIITNFINFLQSFFRFEP